MQIGIASETIVLMNISSTYQAHITINDYEIEEKGSLRYIFSLQLFFSFCLGWVGTAGMGFSYLCTVTQNLLVGSTGEEMMLKPSFFHEPLQRGEEDRRCWCNIARIPE